MGRNEKYLLGFYGLSISLLFLTQYLISKQEERIEKLREMNASTWSLD